MTSGAADIFCHIEKLINKLYVIYMLTKSDLQAIDKLITGRIREEVEAEGRNIRDELKGDIQESRIRIQQEIRDLSDRIKNIEIRINNFEKNSQKEFQKLNKRFTDLFNFLDKDQLRTLKRVERIEEHLNLPPLTN